MTEKLIESDTIVWITFLTQTVSSGATSQSDGAAWDAMFPSEKIPTVTEGDTPQIEGKLQVQCFPSAYVVDENQNFLAIEDCATWGPLELVVQTYG